MPNTILLKRKATAGSVPGTADLQAGELAVNTADGRLYTELSNGTVVNLAVKSIESQAISPSSVAATGVVNSDTGFRISSSATSGNYLRGNGTNFVSAAIQAGDLPVATSSTRGAITDSPSDGLTYGRRNGAWIDLASAANLQFRQGTNADRLAMSPVPLSGEPIWTTDTKRLFIGDGSTTGGLSILGGSNAYVLGMPGDDIATLYTQAKALTPGGASLSATNRGALVLAPGVYSVAALLNFDGEFVDVIGLGSATHNPAVRINGTFVHKVTANDIRIVGLWVNDFQAGADIVSGPATTLPLQVFENCRVTLSFGAVAANRTFAGTLVGCRADGTGSCFFGSNFSTPSAHFSGTAINCTAPSAARAFGSGATVTGTFRACTTTGTIGHAFSATHSRGHGVYENCVGGASSFGGGSASMHLFKDCRATTVAGNASDGLSRYINCVATAGAFPTTAGTTVSSTISQASPAVLALNGGILPAGTAVTLTTTGTLPEPFATGTTYYVVLPVAGTGVSLASTVGGAAINTTTAGSGTHTVNVVTGGKVRNCFGSDFAQVNAG